MKLVVELPESTHSGKDLCRTDRFGAVAERVTELLMVNRELITLHDCIITTN